MSLPFSLPAEHWTLLGRIPALLMLLALWQHARRHVGLERASLAAGGFVAGAAAGTALLPSIIGALGGAAVGWLLTLRLLRARVPSALLFARLSPVLLGIGRVGCLLAGCCFGTPTDAPWGVTYGAHSLAHTLHWHLGLVGESSPALPVHPVQLYEGILALVAAAALPALRRRVRSDAALALGAAAYYAVVRAAIDPLRAMVNTRSSATQVGPLSAFQWGAVVAAVVLGAAAVIVARRARARVLALAEAPAQSDAAAAAGVGPWRFAALWIGQATAAMVAQSALTPFLALLVVGTLALSCGVLVLAALRDLAPARRRAGLVLVAGSLLLVPVGLRAADTGGDDGGGRHWVYDVAKLRGGMLVRIGDQDTPEAALDEEHEELVPAEGEDGEEPLAPEPDQQRHRSIVMYAGGGSSKYDDSSGCNGPTNIYKHAVFLAGAGLEQTSEVEGRRDTWQLRLGVFGDHWHHDSLAGGNGSAVTATASGEDAMLASAAWYHWDWRWAGVGLGGALGLGPSRAPDPIGIALGKAGYILPGVYLRLGPPAIGLELGTGSRQLVMPGPMLSLRSIIAGQEFRLGMESWRFQQVFRTAQIFGDVRLQLRTESALQLHFGVAPGNGMQGTVSWVEEL